jgi:hypothetical protein
MRLLMVCLCLWSVPLSAQWREGATMGVPSDHTRTVLWMGNTSATKIPMIPLPANTWTTVSLADGPSWGAFAPHLPDDVIGVFLSGILVVTNASAAICNITGQFRAPGSQMTEGQYRMQAMAIPGDGDRANVAMWVPVQNKQIEFYWTTNAIAGCSYAVSLTLDAYLRPPSGKSVRMCVDGVCYQGVLSVSQ